MKREEGKGKEEAYWIIRQVKISYSMSELNFSV